jgi:hypothetical protein
VSPIADSSVPITAGSGTPIRVLTALGAASADQQVVTLADSAGNLLGTTAAPVPVNAPDATASGSITAASGVAGQTNGLFSSASLAANSSVSITTSGDGVVTIGWQGNTPLNQMAFEGTIDGTNWTPIYGTSPSGGAVPGTFASTSISSGYARIPAAGLVGVRIRSTTSWTAATVTVQMRASSATGAVYLVEGLPAGSSTITLGAVNIINGGNQVNIKAASTAVASTDTALSVGLHPSSPLPTGANTIGNVGLVAGTAQVGTIAEVRASTLAVTVTAASGSAATLTLPAAGAGLFHYVTAIDMCLYSAAARTGAATPWIVTTTNLPGTPAWTFSTAGAIGATERQWLTPTTPLKSSAANTATTVVGPAATGGIWRITATYFTGT